MIVTDIEKLKVKSKDTNWDEVSELDLINKLKEANLTAWTKGCGLAAIQIGVPVRFAWFKYNGADYYLLNPEIVIAIGRYEHKEGCLSIPNRWIGVVRSYEIEYISDGKKKKAKGLKACIIQHEIDHMNGILTVDIKQEA